MKYPNNDLWTVRSADLLEGALEDMRNKQVKYYPEKEYSLTIPDVATYVFRGVLDFEDDDRTVMFEQGEGFGLARSDIVDQLNKFDIEFTEISS